MIFIDNYKTFKTSKNNHILTVTFDYPPVNIQGLEMIRDLNMLSDKLEVDKDVKVVIFNSSVPNFFIAHADVDMLQNLPTKKVPLNLIQVNDLAKVLNRINKLPQVTIAQIEGYARGGGHEFAQACDMRFAARGKAIFMQMEVGMGILPCGGGTTRLARQVGLGKALEIILGAKDFNADEAESYGSINKALEPDEIGLYVYDLATRISKFPFEAIQACKRTIYASVNMSIDECLKVETYELYQATSTTPAISRFKYAAQTNFQDSLYNQKNFQTLLMDLQSIK
ncbi:MAG: enoyl-CoA hydratase/isomerase family protein [bacterium]